MAETKVIKIPYEPTEVQLMLHNDNHRYKVVIFGRRCLAINTIVAMADGSWKYIQDLKAGDRILSYDGLEVVADTVKNIWASGVKKTVNVSNRFDDIDCTKDHRFYDGNDYTEIQNYNHNIKTYSYRKGLIENTWEEYNDAFLLGCLLTDGSLTQTPKFTNNNKELIDKVKELAMSEYGIKGKLYVKGNGYDLILSTPKKKINPITEKYGHQLKKNRRLPSAVWGYAEKEIYDFLSAVIDCDGSIYISSNDRILDGRNLGKNIEVNINVGESIEAAWDYIYLLRKIGIHANISLDKSTNWKVRIFTGEDKQKLLENLKLIIKEDKRKRALMEIYRQPKKHYSIQRDLIQLTTTIKDEDDEFETYDIEIEENQCFFANGFLVHNSGKSTYSLNEAIKVCLQKSGAKVWVVCPTFNQAKDIYWRDANMVQKYIVPQVVKKMNDSEMLVQFINGSILQFKGSENKDALVGSGLDLVILDECAKMREIEDIWETKLSPALSDKNGKAIFITTPQGYDYIYSLYELGQAKNEMWKSWRIPTWESKAPWTLVKTGKEELERLKNEMNEDAFMQEYGADFRTHTGLVFKEFDRNIHVKDFLVPEERLLVGGADFGFTNPTAFLFGYFSEEETLYIVDEYYEVGKSLAENAGRALAIRFKYPNNLQAIWGDSEDPQIMSEYAKYQMYITPVVKIKDSVTISIDRIRSMLKKNPATGVPKFYIHPRCKNLIMEMERYRWREKQGDMNFKDVPEDAYDHAISALRYIILSHRKTVSVNYFAKPVSFGYNPMGNI